MDGFQGDPMIPAIPIQLQPLVEATWWQSLIQRGINDNKTLDQVIRIVVEESEARNPLHQRRIELLRVKKSDSAHSDFLYKLEQFAELIDFNSLTLDGLISHLFLEQCDMDMGRICQEILAKEPGGNLQMLRSEVKRAEGSVWYKGGHRSTAKRTDDRYCSECDSTTHYQKDCWGPCTHCGRRNHRSSDCLRKKNEDTKTENEKEKEQIRAKKALKNKKEREKKKKKKAERALVEATAKGELSNSESSTSEVDSPVKGRRARLERVGLSGAARRAVSFQNELINMSEEEATEFAESISKALARKASETSNSPIFKAEITPSRTAENGRMEDLVADTGCTKPIVGAQICRDNKIPIIPLTGLKITDASGNYLNICGTAEFYVKSQVLGARKRRVRAAVLEGNTSEREILISMELLQKWDIIHPTFPMETVTQYFNSINKHKKKKIYSSAYRAVYEKSSQSQHKLRDPSAQCIKLKQKMIHKYKGNFASKLSPKDRMSVEPVELVVDESRNIPPAHHTRPFDTPYHLRQAAEAEIKHFIDAEVLTPVSYPTDWMSKAFFVPKSDPSKVRLVADFRQLNKALKRPHWPTESSGQLMRHIDSKAKFFCTIDATQGYHQIPVAKSSQKYLTIVTQQGRFCYTVTPMGVCSSSDLFNLLTDGEVRWEGNNVLKNMDDWLLSGRTLEELQGKMEKLLTFCQSKNLKLNPEKLLVSEEVEFGGTVISAEKVNGEEIIFIDPKDKRVAAFTDMPKPKTKKEVQIFCGLLSSLQAWFPAIALKIPNLRKATASKTKFVWTQLLEEEYVAVKGVMETQIRLSPYDPSKKLRLVIDGASSAGVGFVLFQWVDEKDPGKGACIVAANSSMLGENQVGYSPIDAELLALDFAAKACHYWMWACPSVELYSDCSGLLDMLEKPIANICNRRHMKILTNLMSYRFNTCHIPGVSNKIADALSRLCRRVVQTTHYPAQMPRILSMSKKAAVHTRQLEVLDPMVQDLAEAGAADQDYVQMLTDVENGVSPGDIGEGSELKRVEGVLQHLGTVTLPDGNRLILRNGCEVLVPLSERKRILETLHLDHMSDGTMIRQVKNRIWWPKIRHDLKDIYNNCDACREFRASQPQKQNEISMVDVFANFYPNEEIQIDFAEKGNNDYLMVADTLTGFIQAFPVRNKGTAEATLKVREWSSMFGRPYRIKCDSGPAFRKTFREEMKELGINVVPSSNYNPSSNALVERAVKSLKEILNKGGTMSDLQLRELIFCVNSREQEGGKGSPLSRFLGHGTRSYLPNSLDRNLNWSHLMQIRAEQHQKRVDKPGRCPKEVFEEGERVWVQDIRTKKWDQEGTISAVRTAADGKIVSYDLIVNGHPTIRHRRYLRKCLGNDQAEAADLSVDTAPEAPRRSGRQSRQRSASQSQ